MGSGQHDHGAMLDTVCWRLDSVRVGILVMVFAVCRESVLLLLLRRATQVELGSAQSVAARRPGTSCSDSGTSVVTH